MLLIAWLVVLIAFFILAVQLFVTLIEFKLTTLAGFILVPFGLFSKTAFLAERVLGNVVTSGVKVLVLAVASNDSFRVAWIERRYENASLAVTERWTAILTIVLDTPHDADRLRKNPLGVFVHAINWSKELG